MFNPPPPSKIQGGLRPPNPPPLFGAPGHTYSFIKCSPFKQFCCSFYGSPLWNLNGPGVQSLLLLLLLLLFVFNSINHSNNTCKNILRVKLLSVNSTFAANYQYLSYKYGLIEADWFTPLGHLLGKVKKKMLLLHPHPVLCGILKELCGIRDNTSSCDIANNNDIVALINDICTSN